MIDVVLSVFCAFDVHGNNVGRFTKQIKLPIEPFVGLRFYGCCTILEGFDPEMQVVAITFNVDSGQLVLEIVPEGCSAGDYLQFHEDLSDRIVSDGWTREQWFFPV